MVIIWHAFCETFLLGALPFSLGSVAAVGVLVLVVQVTARLNEAIVRFIHLGPFRP